MQCRTLRVISKPGRDDDRHHDTDNDKLCPAMSNIAFQLLRPPLPLGGRINGNSVPPDLVARMSEATPGTIRPRISPALNPGYERRRQPDEASARGLAPAADESAVW